MTSLARIPPYIAGLLVGPPRHENPFITNEESG
jgi:hypothetical protein